jgi:hypothetical protein
VVPDQAGGSIVNEYLMNYGLPGVVILALSWAVRLLYSDLQKAHREHIKDLMSRSRGISSSVSGPGDNASGPSAKE